MRNCWSVLVLVGLTATPVVLLRAADPAVSDADRLKESLAKWQQAKQKCGGTYTYQVRWSSFVGFGHVTTITVKDNKVVERTFEEVQRPRPIKPGENPPAPKPKWVEKGKDVGRHTSEGARPRTVDELYAEAKKIVDGKLPEFHRRYLGIDKRGLLTHCFLVDTRIADDARERASRRFNCT